MTTQPTALQLADELEDAGKPAFLTDAAAAELRRLHDLLGKANALARIRYEELEMQKALVKEAQDMAVELSGVNAELLEALKKLIGTPDDPNNGWRGTGGTDVLFACEYCNSKHEDCLQIHHIDGCPVTQARAAIARAEGRA